MRSAGVESNPCKPLLPRYHSLPISRGKSNRLGCGCSSGVEHNLAKVGVVGSNPIARSKESATQRNSDPIRRGELSVARASRPPSGDGTADAAATLRARSEDLVGAGAGIRKLDKASGIREIDRHGAGRRPQRDKPRNAVPASRQHFISRPCRKRSHSDSKLAQLLGMIATFQPFGVGQ